MPQHKYTYSLEFTVHSDWHKGADHREIVDAIYHIGVNGLESVFGDRATLSLVRVEDSEVLTVDELAKEQAMEHEGPRYYRVIDRENGNDLIAGTLQLKPSESGVHLRNTVANLLAALNYKLGEAYILRS